MQIFAASAREAAEVFLHAGYISAAGHAQDRLANDLDPATALGTAQGLEVSEALSGPAAATVTEVATSAVATAVAEVPSGPLAAAVADAANASSAPGLSDLLFMGSWWVPGVLLGLVGAVALGAAWQSLVRGPPHRISHRAMPVVLSSMFVGLFAAATLAVCTLRAG